MARSAKVTKDIRADVSSVTTHRITIPLPEVRVEDGDQVEVYIAGPHGRVQRVNLTYRMVDEMVQATRGMDGY